MSASRLTSTVLFPGPVVANAVRTSSPWGHPNVFSGDPISGIFIYEGEKHYGVLRYHVQFLLYAGFATGLCNNRKTIMHVEGLDRTERDELDSNRYMAWLGGQVTLQSQSRTGGFQKPRDVVSTSYYDRVMSERPLTAKELRDRSHHEDTQMHVVHTTAVDDEGEESDSEPNHTQNNGDVAN